MKCDWVMFFFFSSRRRHTRCSRDWSSDVCSSDLGDIRGGKGLLAAVELVEDLATQKNFGADRKVAARIQAEMMKRGVVTRTRAVVGPHPAPGDTIYYAPPLVVTEAEVDRLVAVARDAVKAALGA